MLSRQPPSIRDASGWPLEKSTSAFTPLTGFSFCHGTGDSPVMGSIATICDKLQPRVALNENGDENGFTELTLKLLCCLV
jgi:hypothetical protein